MQENEFEKQVQQKMDDLRIHPSAAAWQNIERRIKKEKRRRGILILLPLLLFGFLYGGYMLLNNDDTATQPLTTNSIEKNNTNEPKAAAGSIKNDSPVEEAKITISKPAYEETGGKNKNITIPEKLKVNTNDVTATLKKDIHPKPASKESMVDKEKINIDIKNPDQEKVITDKTTTPENLITQAKELPKQNQVDSAKANIETTNIETKNENVVAKEEIIITNETKKSTKTKHPWNFGISLSAGSSGMANSLLGSLFGEEQKNARVYSPVSAGGGFGIGIPPAPSLIKSSLAFITVIIAEKNISGKLIFTTGISYKLFSTTNRVGNDSAGFYGTSNANTYHNYYHYIELPVGLKYQLADLKKSLLYWNAGLSVSQLIGAKALQYNSSRGLYYHDNSLFNKTQIGFNTGVDIAFHSKNKSSFLIGPYLNYGISKIASQGYNKHHFTFIGLRAQYIFRKK